jgi:hypothetical protein
MSDATSMSMLPIPFIITATQGNLPRQFVSETYKNFVAAEGCKKPQCRRRKMEMLMEDVSHSNTLEIATECTNALSQTPAIHGRSISILEVPLLK